MEEETAKGQDPQGERQKSPTEKATGEQVSPEFARAENEDDDGYDPYSDRRPRTEPLFERDPWT